MALRCCCLQPWAWRSRTQAPWLGALPHLHLSRSGVHFFLPSFWQPHFSIRPPITAQLWWPFLLCTVAPMCREHLAWSPPVWVRRGKHCWKALRKRHRQDTRPQPSWVNSWCEAEHCGACGRAWESQGQLWLWEKEGSGSGLFHWTSGRPPVAGTSDGIQLRGSKRYPGCYAKHRLRLAVRVTEGRTAQEASLQTIRAHSDLIIHSLPYSSNKYLWKSPRAWPSTGPGNTELNKSPQEMHQEASSSPLPGAGNEAAKTEEDTRTGAPFVCC